MQCAAMLITIQVVRVCQITLEARRIVDLNVSSILIVRAIRFAKITSAAIVRQMFAVKMQFVKLSPIQSRAFVPIIMSEILSIDAHPILNNKNLKIHVI
jgi:hypothetical protein